MRQMKINRQQLLVHVPEGCVLKILNLAESIDHALAEATEARRARQDLHERIAECEENGMVVVIESGMDCDCVQYDGRKHPIPATVQAFDKLAQSIGEWADGVFTLSIVSPSEAREISYRSRDRALEAYEDGHSHIVYMGAL